MATKSQSGYCLCVIFIILQVVLVLYIRGRTGRTFGLLYSEYLVSRSLSNSLISLNFIIYILKELLDVALSSNFTYGSIRVSNILVVDYSNYTIDRE